VKLTTHLHLVPRSKNAWSYNSTPQSAFMVWCSVKMAQGQLYVSSSNSSVHTLYKFLCLTEHGLLKKYDTILSALQLTKYALPFETRMSLYHSRTWIAGSNSTLDMYKCLHLFCPECGDCGGRIPPQRISMKCVKSFIVLDFNFVT
jgi:hypothetical protein